ncbi:MAG: hypothetical protein AAFZ80_01905 [Cyanobacteria bacterium P01_A01_bin.105]
MANVSRNLWRRVSLALTLPYSALGLATVAIQPGSTADDDFFNCTADLLDAGIVRDAAAAACAASLQPGTLSNCAVDVADFTGIAVADALVVCERSRRPDEVANCTLDIHDSLLEGPSLSAHTFCGRSLLPERYSVCVIDLVDAADLTVDESLTRCIRAGYRPWEMGPRL